MNRIVAKQHTRSLLEAVIATIVLTVTVPCAKAQTENWNGGGGNWNDAGNWTPGTVPDGSTIDVVISGSSADLSSVTLDNISPTIHNLSLDSFSTLTITGQSLYVSGPSITNAGQINVGNASLYADINGGAVTLSGGGIVSLTDPNAYIRGYYGNETVFNTNNTIQGQGYIYALSSFQNAGIVNANVSGGTLQIDGVTTTNTNTLEATGGGTLSIYSTTVNNAGGTISTGSTSSVVINNSTIEGGNLTSGTGAAIQGTGSVYLDGVTLTTGSTYSVNGGQKTYLTADFVNKGTVNIGVLGNAATLFADNNGGTINLSGGGTINLNDPNSEIRGYYGNETLVNKDNLIQGQGYISNLSSFNNQGTVNANVSGGTIYLDGVPTTNTGTLEATNGGTLNIYNTTVNDTGDTISSDASSHIVITNSTINGGSLDSGGSVIHATGSDALNGVTLTSGSIYSVDGGQKTYLTSDFVNKGTVNIGALGNAATLFADNNGGTINLSGGGAINLNDPNSYLRGYVGNETLVNKDNLIQGQGYISNLSSFNNQGTVNANVSGGTIYLYGVPTTNTGTLEATNGGTLNIYGTTVNDTGYTISSDASSHIVISNSTINGGSLDSGGSVIHATGSDVLNGVTLTSGSIYSVDGGQKTYLTSDFVNKGTVNVGVLGNAATLYADNNGGTINLSGGGTINLNDPNSYLRGYVGNETLVNKDNIIQGQGYISNLSSFNNQGTVNANVSGGTIYLYGVPTTNTGTLEATNGGTLNINGTTVNDTGYTISSDASSHIVISNSTINGGSLDSGGSVIHATGSDVLNGVTLTSGSIYSVDGGQKTYLTSDFVNKGTVNIGALGNAATLFADNNGGTINLSGGGAINLNDPNSYLRGYVGNETLVNKDNLIQGQGYIYSLGSFQNQGTVNANVSGGTLYIDSAPTSNSGTLEAQAGASLNLNATTLTNFASTGATAGTLTGGTYQVNSGTLSFNNGGYTNDIVTNAATILLDGTSGSPNFIDQNGNNALAHFATNAAAGSFTIQNGVSVTSDSSTDFHNAGTMNIGATSTFTVGGGHDYTQSGGLTYLQAGTSDLIAHTININGGTLQGFGTVTGDLVNGGIVHPGDGPGILSVTGNYTQTSSGILDIQIGGPKPGNPGFAQLNITGTAALGGTLDVSLFNGFTPYNGETFTILTSAGLNSSVFAAFNGLQEGNVTFTVAYTPGDVILDAIVPQSVPEPVSLVMLGIGIAGLGAYVVRRRRHA